MNRPEVLIIGSGLAGLSSGLELALQGRSVLLVEAKGHVGGRTASWDQEGMLVESGLHRFLGFYSALPALLKKAGINSNDILIWEDEIEIRTPDGGPTAVFGAAPLFRPWQTIRGALGNNHMFSPLDKLTLARFLLAGLRDYYLRPADLDKQTAFEYAQKHGLSERVTERFLFSVTTGTFFISYKRYSAYDLFGLLGPYLHRVFKFRVGAFAGGMTEVMCDPIARAIETRGGVVRRDAEVSDLLVEKGVVKGAVVASKEVAANQVILAASLGSAQDLLRSHVATHSWFQPMLSLATMPAVTVQMELDEPSMIVDHTTFGPGTILASFSEQSRTTFRHVPGRLSVIIGSPEAWIGKSSDEIVSQALQDAQRLGLNVEGKVRQYRVIAEPRDFYSLTPGSEALRPSQQTPIPGLTLAGDYTKQPYLATMEGAVVSGKLAAKAVIGVISKAIPC